MPYESAITVRNLCKTYHIYRTAKDRLRQSVLNRLRGFLRLSQKQYFDEYHALNNVTFSVKKGEVIGIIGKNGAGKSTLLQILCGTLNPTAGSVVVNGRIAALLELGAGFNPEFTGKENVYMNAAILGLSKREIDKRYNEIISFADIGEYIDQPVKMYSSGMFVRLAFAVIAHVNADILIIDEALAVGDAFFTQKCMRFIRNFHKSGGSIVFVSHDTNAVMNICDNALLLFAGGSKAPIYGPAESLCKAYLSQVYEDPGRLDEVSYQEIEAQEQPIVNGGLHSVIFGEPDEENIIIISSNKLADSFGYKKGLITHVGFYSANGSILNTIIGGKRVILKIFAKVDADLVNPAFGFMIKDRLGQYLYTDGTDANFRGKIQRLKRNTSLIAEFDFVMPLLSQGTFTLNVAFAEGEGHDHVQQHWIHDALKLESVSSPVAHGLCGVVEGNKKIEIINA